MKPLQTLLTAEINLNTPPLEHFFGRYQGGGIYRTFRIIGKKLIFTFFTKRGYF